MDSLKWQAFTRVEKYSPAQAAHAEQWLAGNPGTEHGDQVEHRLLRLLFPDGPEHGVAEIPGNLVTNGGLNLVTELLTGAALTGSVLSNTYGFCGVGAGTTAASVTDTHLTDDAGSAFYQKFDTSYPAQSGAVITGISTFGTSSANFAWQEWCWGVSTVAVGASTGATMASLTAGTEIMVNHGVQSLGTKLSGASWVFTATITQS